MSRGSSITDKDYIKYDDDDVVMTDGGLVFQFEPQRQKLVMGTYTAQGQGNSEIVFWGEHNALPEYREALLSENTFVPQIIRTKRDIILGGGLMGYREVITAGERILEEVALPTRFTDFLGEQEEMWGGMEDLANDLLKHGQYYVECIRNGADEIVTMKPHPARCVRAQKQDTTGRIPAFWLSGGWSKVNDPQRLSEVKELLRIPAYNRQAETPQGKFMLQGADRLLGGPYYYDPHYAGSTTWIKVANMIPRFHQSNLQNGFNIRYVIKVPEDYFLRSLSEAKRKDTTQVQAHIAAAKSNFKSKINSFLAGADNAGRGLIITKHFYKHLQKEWPELEIVPLQVDLKDEAMLKLYESSNQANTSAHGIPPVLAGLATGAKMTSGSEIRNLYNFWQISATPAPRKCLLQPYNLVWRSMKLDPTIKLGFRNIELTTTDKNPNGQSDPIVNE